jgi:hypothetical protein
MARATDEEAKSTWEASGNGVGRRLNSKNTEKDCKRPGGYGAAGSRNPGLLTSRILGTSIVK